MHKINLNLFCKVISMKNLKLNGIECNIRIRNNNEKTLKCKKI